MPRILHPEPAPLNLKRFQPRRDPDSPLTVAECRQLSHATFPLLERHLSLPRPDLAAYSSQDRLAIPLLSDLRRSSPEAAEREAHLLHLLRPSGKARHLPSADTALAALHALPTERLHQRLQALHAAQIAQAVTEGAVPSVEPLILAGDCHDILTYHKKPRRAVGHPRPSQALPKAVGTNPERGTTLAFRYLTLQTTRGPPLTVAVTPFLPLENHATKLRAALDLSEERLGRKVDLLLYDAAAYSNEMILRLKDRVPAFVVRAPQNQRVARLLTQHQGLLCFVVQDFAVRLVHDRCDAKKATATLVAVSRDLLDEEQIETPHTEKRVKWFTFLTTLARKPNESERGFTLRVARLYKERWDVETGSRGHEELRGFTHALHYDVRMLQYFLAVVLSNVWALQRWRSGEAWTKKGLAEFLAYTLLLGLPGERGIDGDEVQVSSRAVHPTVALGRGHQET